DVVEKVKHRSHNMWVPLIVLVGMTVFSMWWTGGGPEGASFGDAIGNADAALSLFWGVMVAVIVTLGMNLGQRLGGLTRNMDAFTGGLRMMLFACTILVLAWSIKAACDAVGTAPYLVGVLEGMPVVWLPVGIFVV
ncbi:unnamed protein product, partial [marine sediment metagenome]